MQSLSVIECQGDLLKRKYFKTATTESANFLEGYANSRFSFTSANLQATADTKNLGITPDEIIFRFEPTLVFEGGAQAAIIGTVGLTHTYFPPVIRDRSGSVSLGKSATSVFPEKAGLRCGIGAGMIDDKARLLIGAGVQLHAFGIWGLYEPKRSNFLLGISVSDLSKVKKVIGWFD
jgi:hypothetical protein